MWCYFTDIELVLGGRPPCQTDAPRAISGSTGGSWSTTTATLAPIARYGMAEKADIAKDLVCMVGLYWAYASHLPETLHNNWN